MTTDEVAALRARAERAEAANAALRERIASIRQLLGPPDVQSWSSPLMRSPGRTETTMTTFDSAEATRIMERLRRMAADGDRAVAAFDAVVDTCH